ncbi:CRE-ACDH-13 protein [Caenorhabditis remanei]|uniref:CRE-ACDH-13 protein n=1 Tax=Caenorhabditis remanei TaxID=31234 RepID=E3NAL9_CAERE|nr:CRE-ACDH-13 protein [Caenorhabditis remanei]
MHRALLRVQKFQKYTARCLSDAGKAEKLAEFSEKSKYAIRTLDNSSPIEKRSLSRGFAMNRFEKDFMIYPEYTDSDDVRNIEGFVDILQKSLNLSVDSKIIEKEGNLPSEVIETLRSNAIFSVSIPKDFGGIGMKNKEISKVFEELSIDWNIYTSAQIALQVSNILTIYGSDEQKSKYLTALSDGKLRPAVAIVKDTNGGKCELTTGPQGKSMLNGENIRVIGHHNANFYVVFGDNKGEQTCFILDETELATTDKIKFHRDETFGLKGTDIGRIELTALVNEKNVLGAPGNGTEISAELTGSGRMPFAAATVGMAKRTLRELSIWCNRTPSRRTDRSVLSVDSRSQRLVTDLALKVYSLESALYYLSGLIDEGLSIVVDIENSLLSMLTRDVLQTRLTSAPRLISCNQLSRFLEVMADLIPNEKGSEGEVDYRRQIKSIDSVEFDKRIESCGIRGDFYKEDKTTAEYLKKKMRKILLEPAILEVFDDNVFGFDFSTKDCINALENYFSLNAPDKDNGLTSKALHIKIHQFIRSCHHVARSQNPKFQLNDRLKMALFD